MPTDTLAPPAPPARTSSQVAADAARTTVNVGAIAPTAGETTPVKPGSAMSRMRAELEKRATIADPSQSSAKPAPRKRPGAPTPQDAPDAPETPDAPDTPPDDKSAASAEQDAKDNQPAEAPKDGKTPVTAPKEGTKPNPWRLVDEWKGRAAKLETQLAEIQKTGATPEAVKKVEERATKAEARIAELQKELSFYDYSSDPGFKEKYEAPYEAAWTRAMGELKELTVNDGAGNERPFSANDMLKLVNLPLQQARTLAEEQFGSFANDIMTHRKEIKSLLESRQQALDEARRTGGEEIRKRREAQETTRKSLRAEIGATWAQENEAVKKDPAVSRYFTPVEGDEEGNAALEKGFKLVDEAFAASPEDPSLTPEQRREIVRKHAAIRNRAASWGRMRKQLEKTVAENADLKKKLKSYESSEPATQGRETSPSGAQTGSARESVFGELRRRAR